MSSQDYGLFVICYSVIFALAGITASLISAPMALRLHPNNPVESKEVASKSLYLCCFGFVALGPFGLTIISLSDSSRTFLTEAFGVILSSFFYGLKDVLAKLTYALRQENHFLHSNVLIGLTVVPSFLALESLDYSASTQLSLFVYSSGQAIGFLYLLWALKVPLKKHPVACLREHFLELFPHGKWNFLSSVLYTVRTQAHNFIAGPLLGLSGVARINAARNLVMPVMLLPPPIGQILIARLVSQRPGAKTSTRLVKAAIIFLLSISSLYFTLLLVSYDYVTAITGNYQSIHHLVTLWALISCVLAAKTILSTALEARGFFRELFSLNLYGALIAVPASLALGYMHAETGAIIALLVTESILCALVFNLYIKVLKTQGI